MMLIMNYGFSHTALNLALIGLAIATPSSAWCADKVRLTGLSDANFGTINGTIDQTISQNVCAYSNSATTGYSVTALGSGSGGAFSLASGSAQMSYDLLWSDAANQIGGRSLAPGIIESGFTAGSSQQFCNSGPSSTASLTVVIRSVALASARAGSYSGQLTITIAPE